MTPAAAAGRTAVSEDRRSPKVGVTGRLVAAAGRRCCDELSCWHRRCSTARRARGSPWREASTKRTSSMTCCGCSDLHRVDHVGAELLGDGHRLVERRRASGAVPDEHDAAVDRRDAEAARAGSARQLAPSREMS